jgi:hypothetical protein
MDVLAGLWQYNKDIRLNITGITTSEFNFAKEARGHMTPPQF